jgi:hypothetical protein
MFDWKLILMGILIEIQTWFGTCKWDNCVSLVSLVKE